MKNHIEMGQVQDLTQTGNKRRTSVSCTVLGSGFPYTLHDKECKDLSCPILHSNSHCRYGIVWNVIFAFSLHKLLSLPTANKYTSSAC